jgi:hypothetical protein
MNTDVEKKITFIGKLHFWRNVSIVGLLSRDCPILPWNMERKDIQKQSIQHGDDNAHPQRAGNISWSFRY